MKLKIIITILLSGIVFSQEPPAVKAPEPVLPTPIPVVETPNPKLVEAKKEQEILAAENTLNTEKLKRDTTELSAELTKIKLENEVLNAKAALETNKRDLDRMSKADNFRLQTEQVIFETSLAKARADKANFELKAVQSEAELAVHQIKSSVTRIQAEASRNEYVDAKPIYLEKPLKENGTLVVSDRRIPFSGPVTDSSATYICDRIQYFNNKDKKFPIFIVIDSSPGGSVMAGNRILKAMEGSEAPIHVVVKSFAASMAAAITTLANESYAYPNAVILHHQISSTLFFAQLNLTQQKEFYEQSKRWWTRFGNPIAEKMKITPDEFIKKMYQKESSGDWAEFGDEAVKLKWVNHIVQDIDETSYLKDPKLMPTPQAVEEEMTGLKQSLDKDGRSFVILPRLNPLDVWFLYNPDNYYKIQ
jgi:ATP-dependent Clp protease, protease subunit